MTDLEIPQPLTLEQIRNAPGLLGRFDILDPGRSLYDIFKQDQTIHCVAIVTFRYTELLRLIQMEVYEDRTFQCSVSGCPVDTKTLAAAARAHEFVEVLGLRDLKGAS